MGNRLISLKVYIVILWWGSQQVHVLSAKITEFYAGKGLYIVKMNTQLLDNRSMKNSYNYRANNHATVCTYIYCQTARSLYIGPGEGKPCRLQTVAWFQCWVYGLTTPLPLKSIFSNPPRLYSSPYRKHGNTVYFLPQNNGYIVELARLQIILHGRPTTCIYM